MVISQSIYPDLPVWKVEHEYSRVVFANYEEAMAYCKGRFSPMKKRRIPWKESVTTLSSVTTMTGSSKSRCSSRRTDRRYATVTTSFWRRSFYIITGFDQAFAQSRR